MNTYTASTHLNKLLGKIFSLLIILKLVFLFLNFKIALIFFALFVIVGFTLFAFGANKKTLSIIFTISTLVFVTFFTLQNFKYKSSGTDNVLQSTKNINLSTTTVKDFSVDDSLQEIYILINSENGDKTEITNKLIAAIANSEKLATTTNPKSYMDLGRVYEVATMFGIASATDKTLEAYNKYCLLLPNDPECYAAIARFLQFDKKKKREAVVFAKKALSLSRSQKETEIYTALVEHLER